MEPTIHAPIYKLYGLSDKENFTKTEYDELYSTYIEVTDLHKAKIDYDKLLLRKQSAESQLTAMQTHNANPPDFETEKGELQATIDSIDTNLAIEGLSYLDEKQLLTDKEQFQNQLDGLLEQEALKDTTEIEATVAQLTTEVSDQALVVNEISQRLGIGDLV